MCFSCLIIFKMVCLISLPFYCNSCPTGLFENFSSVINGFSNFKNQKSFKIKNLHAVLHHKIRHTLLALKTLTQLQNMLGASGILFKMVHTNHLFIATCTYLEEGFSPHSLFEQKPNKFHPCEVTQVRFSDMFKHLAARKICVPNPVSLFSSVFKENTIFITEHKSFHLNLFLQNSLYQCISCAK